MSEVADGALFWTITHKATHSVPLTFTFNRNYHTAMLWLRVRGCDYNTCGYAHLGSRHRRDAALTRGGVRAGTLSPLPRYGTCLSGARWASNHLNCDMGANSYI
jgi:hypothetical protein